MKYKDMQKQLKKRLKPNRYRHTLGVVETAKELAVIYGYDAKIAEIAALLHDCAKNISDEDKIRLCGEYGVSITDAEMNNPSLLHAKCGAILAKRDYEVTNEDILHAITYHTTGCANMGLLDQIIFVADYIEPGRDKAPHLDILRKEARENLNYTCYLILKDTVDYLSGGNKDKIDDTTWKAYEFYKQFAS